MRLIFRENQTRCVNYFNLDLDVPRKSIWLATDGEGTVRAYKLRPAPDSNNPDVENWEWLSEVPGEVIATVDLEGTHPRDTLQRYPL